MKEISALIKDILESSLTPSALRGHSEKTAVEELGGELSPDSKSAP